MAAVIVINDHVTMTDHMADWMKLDVIEYRNFSQSDRELEDHMKVWVLLDNQSTMTQDPPVQAIQDWWSEGANGLSGPYCHGDPAEWAGSG